MKGPGLAALEKALPGGEAGQKFLEILALPTSPFYATGFSFLGFSGGQERKGTPEEPRDTASPALGEGKEGDREAGHQEEFCEHQRLSKSGTGCPLRGISGHHQCTQGNVPWGCQSALGVLICQLLAASQGLASQCLLSQPTPFHIGLR